MNCGELENRLVEIARGAEDPEALNHAASCPACALRLSGERSLTAGLKAVARHAQEPPPLLEASLLAAFERNRKAAAPVWGKWCAAAGAIAAAALILAFGRSADPPPPPVLARIEISMPEPRPQPAPPALAARHRTRRPTAALKATAVATEFYPIPYAEPLSTLERAELVRVRMDNRVEADLVVGQDGLARAIRFIGKSQ